MKQLIAKELTYILANVKTDRIQQYNLAPA